MSDLFFIIAGLVVNGPGEPGAGEGAPARLPQGLTDGEQDPSEDEPQFLSHGKCYSDQLLLANSVFLHEAI